MIHLAFKHDIAFSGDFQGAPRDADRRAVETFGEALHGVRPATVDRLRDTWDHTRARGERARRA